MDQLVALLDGWKSRKIVVVGDFMLDRYIRGNADRLSPDAPVPVLAVRKETHEAGGAANVCRDLAALRCKVAAVGVVGRDEAAEQLKDALRKDGVNTAGLVAATGRPTTVKENIVGLAQHRHPQKMFRIDREDNSPIDAKLADRLLAAVKTQLPGAAALCIEDYNKGVLTPAFCRKLIKAARDAGVPSLVDPAAIEDYSKYHGATCITPNRTEAELATGVVADEDNAAQMARALRKRHAFESVVLTLDRHGALLLEGRKKPQVVPTVARQVYDVTGAGDMVLAMLAAARANGATMRDAVQLANIAAGLEVERFGVVPIALEEVRFALMSEIGKHRTVEQLLPDLAFLRDRGKRIVFTNGCFDVLHIGHVQCLREAAALGDVMIVAINDDASVRKIKGKTRPINNQDDRAEVLAALECVDYVLLFSESTPTNLLKRIKPDVLVKGGDYKPSQVVGAKLVKSWGGKVKVVKLAPGKSTSNLIEKMKEA